MSHLHAIGWRQGSILSSCPLPVAWLVLEGEVPTPRQEVFENWVVCTQDCDLAASVVDDCNATIELRPINTGAGASAGWGIRNRQFVFSDGYATDSFAPRLMVSPALLAMLGGCREELSPEPRLRAFKTWLGLRYDRPAVPDHLVEAAKEVAKRFASKGGRVTAEGVHDVLMQFDDEAVPPQVHLFAVVSDEADLGEVRRLADTATRVRAEVCIIASIDAATRADTSLELIETTYGVDLTQLTWAGREPTGAE